MGNVFLGKSSKNIVEFIERTASKFKINGVWKKYIRGYIGKTLNCKEQVLGISLNKEDYSLEYVEIGDKNILSIDS